MRRCVLPVVQEEEYRGMFRRSVKKVAEAAHRIWSNRLLLEGANPQMAKSLAGEHIEMVEPESGHYLLQLTRSFEGPNDSSLHSLMQDKLRPSARSPFVIARRELPKRHLISD